MHDLRLAANPNVVLVVLTREWVPSGQERSLIMLPKWKAREGEIMNSQWRILVFAALAAGSFCLSGFAQATPPPPTVLRIQIQNFVNYNNDVTDWTKLAKDP